MGSILAQSREFMLSYPQIGIIAGIPILMTVLSINLLADALRARLDPKGRRDDPDRHHRHDAPRGT